MKQLSFIEYCFNRIDKVFDNNRNNLRNNNIRSNNRKYYDNNGLNRNNNIRK